MSRTPRPHRPGAGDSLSNRVIGDEPPVPPYPLRRGGVATPDRSQPSPIGPACYDTDTTAPAPAFTDELRSSVELGTTRGNNEVQKTSQEHADSVRESRGVVTRPVRPGQHW
jgi:hypothetical protein